MGKKLKVRASASVKTEGKAFMLEFAPQTKRSTKKEKQQAGSFGHSIVLTVGSYRTVFVARVFLR